MRGVVVLGMHRSGTSALTRVLNLLGATLPPDVELLHGLSDNPAGHWESRDLVAGNDRILATFGRSWDFPPYLRRGWELGPRATALLPALRETFDQLHRGSPWVFKDPRTCLTLPLWRRALGDDVGAVLVLRDPEAIASSLLRREGIPRFYGIGLFHHYMSAALAGAAGMPLVRVRFEEVAAAPLEATAQLATDLSSLGLDLPGSVEDAAASLRRDLVHEQSTPAHRRGALALAERILDDIPPVSANFVPPAFSEPRWVRPAITAYRGWWYLRSRTGHPLRPAGERSR